MFSEFIIMRNKRKQQIDIILSIHGFIVQQPKINYDGNLGIEGLQMLREEKRKIESRQENCSWKSVI